MPLQKSLTQGRIFWFWLPLGAMWLMMAIEQPVIASVMARLPEPEINLAAFGLMFGLALFVEGPVVMLLTAGTALPKDRQSYQRLLRFTHLLAVGLTALHVAIGATPLYGFIVRTLIGAPEPVIAISRVAFLLMTPWTAAIAYRRLWQGVLIRFDRTRIVPLTIAARLVTTTSLLLLGLLWGRFPGAYVGSAALSIGVIAAALVSHGFARGTIREHLSEDDPTVEPLSWSELLTFYIPLALTSLIVLANMPLFSTTLSRAPQALLSLALWPVLNSLFFLGRSVSLSLQEAVVALLADRQSYEELRRFVWAVAGVLLVLFALVIVTPLSQIWYGRISGLSPNLVEFAKLPTALAIFIPAISALISWQRGILIHVKQTQYVSHSVVMSVTVLVILMGLGVWLVDWPGAVIASGAFSLSVTAEWLYLWWRSQAAAREAGFVSSVSMVQPQSVEV